MTTNADIGHGTTYEIFDPDLSTPALVQLGEVTNIDLGGDEADLVDVTHADSPNNRREYIGGLVDGGESTIELNFVPNNTTHQLLVARLEAGDAQQHKITFPNGATATFNAIVRSVGATVPIDDKMVLTFSAKSTGTVAWAPS